MCFNGNVGEFYPFCAKLNFVMPCGFSGLRFWQGSPRWGSLHLARWPCRRPWRSYEGFPRPRGFRFGCLFLSIHRVRRRYSCGLAALAWFTAALRSALS